MTVNASSLGNPLQLQRWISTCAPTFREHYWLFALCCCQSLLGFNSWCFGKTLSGRGSQESSYAHKNGPRSVRFGSSFPLLCQWKDANDKIYSRLNCYQNEWGCGYHAWINSCKNTKRSNRTTVCSMILQKVPGKYPSTTTIILLVYR